jgi:hypothetical protein
MGAIRGPFPIERLTQMPSALFRLEVRVLGVLTPSYPVLATLYHIWLFHAGISKLAQRQAYAEASGEPKPESEAQSPAPRGRSLD